MSCVFAASAARAGGGRAALGAGGAGAAISLGMGVEPEASCEMPAMRLSSSETAAAAMREMVWSGEDTCACSSWRT